MNTEIINVVKSFSCSHRLWTNDTKHNKRTVEMILDYCYERFRTKRYLFLNEVYQELGIPMTRQGQIAGWVYNREHVKDHMWTVWTKDDGYNDVYITFEPLRDILDALPNEQEES